MTEADAVPAQAPQAFLEVRDLVIHFPTDDGLVKSVDGLSFGLERGNSIYIFYCLASYIVARVFWSEESELTVTDLNAARLLHRFFEQEVPTD